MAKRSRQSAIAYTVAISYMLFSILFVAGGVLSFILPTIKYASAVTPGGVFVTGHDPDFHAVQGGNALGAQHIIQKAISYVTNGKASPKILLVTDVANPGGGFSDPRLGMTAAGFTFDVADFGSGTAGVLDLHTVNFANYDVVVVASDFGGWLRQSELDILNARSADILAYVNGGGGLVAFAESGPPFGLTTHNPFGYLPFLVSSAAKNQAETGNTVTPAGTALGLTILDVNGNASHNIFTGTGGMDVIDNDPTGAILSLAERSKTIGVTGVAAVGGEIIPVDMVALFVAGITTNAFWIAPTFGGVAVAAVTIFKIKRKHN